MHVMTHHELMNHRDEWDAHTWMQESLWCNPRSPGECPCCVSRAISDY